MKALYYFFIALNTFSLVSGVVLNFDALSSGVIKGPLVWLVFLVSSISLVILARMEALESRKGAKLIRQSITTNVLVSKLLNNIIELIISNDSLENICNSIQRLFAIVLDDEQCAISIKSISNKNEISNNLIVLVICRDSLSKKKRVSLDKLMNRKGYSLQHFSEVEWDSESDNVEKSALTYFYCENVYKDLKYRHPIIQKWSKRASRIRSSRMQSLLEYVYIKYALKVKLCYNSIVTMPISLVSNKKNLNCIYYLTIDSQKTESFDMKTNVALLKEICNTLSKNVNILDS